MREEKLANMRKELLIIIELKDIEIKQKNSEIS